MSWRVGFAWAALSAAVVSVAFATVRGSVGEGDDARPPGPAVVPPNGPGELGERSEPGEPPPLDPELATALYRVGLQPENLAAAGVSATLADDVVAGVKVWLAQNPAGLPQTDERYFQAVTSRDALVRKVRSGLASTQEIVEGQDASGEFDAAEGARKQVLEALFTAGTVVLSTDQVAALSRIRVNQAAWNVPLQYLVVDRTQEEWVHVRAALANERISAKDGEDPDAEDQSYLAEVRADSAVAAAKTSLDTNLGAVKSAWEAAAAKE